MEIKKNNRQNLELSKLNFLSIGLIISILLVLSAFNYNGEKPVHTKYLFENVVEQENAPITRNDEIVKPIPIKTIQTVINSEILEIVDNNTDVDSTISIWTENSPIEIDVIEEPPIDIFFHVQVMPKFPGGDKALLAFIYKNVNYPTMAKENNIQGTVHMRFEITKTGSIGQIIIQNNPDQLLQDASIDVIKKLPKWKPGFQNGNYVSVWFSLPITFKLN